MKIVLNLLIAASIIVIMYDVDRNSYCDNLNFSLSIYALTSAFFFGFFRVFYDEFIDFITRPK